MVLSTPQVAPFKHKGPRAMRITLHPLCNEQWWIQQLLYTSRDDVAVFPIEFATENRISEGDAVQRNENNKQILNN